MIFVFASTGCTDILEGYKLDESPHIAVTRERPPVERIEVSNYDGLRSALFELVTEHETEGLIIIYSYDREDVQADVDSICFEIMNEYPPGIFSVSLITGEVTRIVSFFEIDISVEYKRTKEQVDSIVNVSTLRYLRTELLSIMSDYREDAVLLTSLQISEEDLVEYARETYYQNPRSIVMMPTIAVTTFSAGGEDKFLELSVGTYGETGIMRRYGASLALSVRRNAVLAVGENDAEILLSLAENLIAACLFDEGTARTISEHGAQNIAVTAYGALVRGSAVGEGFAMAFKALCDELDFDCRVVLGTRDGMVHAWNIVALYGDYYHIDVAMCAMNGIKTAFLRSDSAFLGDYSWDIDNTIRCYGRLTYEDIVGPEDPPVEPPEGTEEDTDEETDIGEGILEEPGKPPEQTGETGDSGTDEEDE